MSKEWNFLQELVFNFGAELASNPTQYMMERAFADRGLNWRYVQFEFSPETLGQAVRAMRVLGFRGGNCTMPYKVAIIDHLDQLGESASLMRAVNCVVRRRDELIGENTDGKGFLESLRKVADPAGQSVVILGAGGAARAIACELALAGSARMRVVNRSTERGAALVRVLKEGTAIEAEFVEWQGDFKVPDDVGLLVNATSIGMSDREARVPLDLATLRKELIVADVIVNPPDTWLIRAARDRHCRAIDGLGMVVNQAVIAFNLWTGTDANPQVMHSALCEVLGLDESGAGGS